MLKKSTTAKVLASVLGLSMVLGFASTASAQTTADLTAQINALLAQIATLQAQLNGGASTGGASTTFTSDLTVGSTGAQVTALQQWLAAKGFLTMPAGTAYGYFGNLTKMALAKYQASAGIMPASGYFGPITRAKVNAAAGTTGGNTGGTTGGSTGITTPGAEGTLTVSSSNTGLVSTVYEGDDMAPVLAFTAEAKNSDIAIQRVKIDLGEDSKIYNKGYTKLYVTDGSNTLASVDLNSSTVVKEGSTYYVTITGFNLVVAKNSKKNIVIKADVRDSIESTDRTTLNSIGLAIPANGVRGVDGAGIDQYGPSAALSDRTTTFSAELSETATLALSLNSSSVKKTQAFATSGSAENELDKLSLMTFDLKAEKDEVTVTDMGVSIAKAGAGAANASTTVYLYDGSTELDSASLTGTGANGSFYNFTDLDLVVPKGTTKTITVKADIRSANGTAATFTASASTTGTSALVSENSKGDSVTESGSATGYGITVRNEGLDVQLVSKSITTSGVPQTSGANNPSTSTVTANFTFKVKAVGAAQMLGLTQSTSSPFVSSTTSFDIYRNGSVVTDVGSNSTSTAFTVDSICTGNGSSYTNSCSLAEGSEVTIPVSFQLQGRKSTGATETIGLYAFGINALYASGNTINFMDNENDWRTADVSFP
jgi:hypothetical protein